MQAHTPRIGLEQMKRESWLKHFKSLQRLFYSIRSNIQCLD